MTLPVYPNPISLNQVNVELGFADITLITMNQTSVRTLFGVPSGTIAMSNGHGKSNRVTVNLGTLPNPTLNYNVYTNRGGTYVAGKTDFIVTIGAGFVLGSNSVASYALSTAGCTTGDTLTVYNNGYIVGKGGDGGKSQNGTLTNPVAGGPAVFVNIPTQITNANGYIYSGGGGGGSAWKASSYFYAPPSYTPVLSPEVAAGGGGGGGYNAGIGGVASAPPYNNAFPGIAGNLTHGGNGAHYLGAGGALNVAGQKGNIISYSYGVGGGGGGGGGANGGWGSAWAGISVAGAGHGVAIQGISNVTWVSGNTRVYGGTA